MGGGKMKGGSRANNGPYSNSPSSPSRHNDHDVGFGAPIGTPMDKNNSAAGLHEAIKSGQRVSSDFKDAWHKFCEKNGSGTFDPTKHSVEFLGAFFGQLGQLFLEYCHNLPQVADPGFQQHKGGGKGYHQKGKNQHGGHQNGFGGAPQDPTRDPEKLQDLVNMVVEGRIHDMSWQQSWVEWCNENGDGVMDPSQYKNEPMFIIAFVFKWGLAAVCDIEWAKPYLVSLGDVSKPFMVQAVKKGQSADADWKEAWGVFADEKLNYRDPALHDPGSLLEFFDTIATIKFRDRKYLQIFLCGRER